MCHMVAVGSACEQLGHHPCEVKIELCAFQICARRGRHIVTRESAIGYLKQSPDAMRTGLFDIGARGGYQGAVLSGASFWGFFL